MLRLKFHNDATIAPIILASTQLTPAEKNGFITFGKFDMQTGVKSMDKTKYALLTKRFCDAMDDYLKMADVVLIEAQMQAKMKMIQTAMQCFYWEKSHVIGPLAVRKFFGISMSNYAKNKKTSVILSGQLIHSIKEKNLMKTLQVGMLLLIRKN